MNTLPGTLAELFAYDDWANDRLLTAAAGCGDPELDTAFEMGEGSLRKTMCHLWAAEHCWLERWLGVPVTVARDEALDVPTLRTRLLETARQRQAWGERQDAGTLERSFRYRRPSWMEPGPDVELHTGICVLHVLNHGVHHRAQAVNMLKRLGAPVPALDYIRRPAAGPAQLDLGTLRRYLAYGDWAWRQVHRAVAGLTDGARHRSFPIGPGTLQRILRHLADAPAWWFEALEHGPGHPFPAIEESDTLDELWNRHASAVECWNRYLDGVGDQELEHLVTVTVAPGKERSFSLGTILVQLCTHGTHHRAQGLNMLRHLGGNVPDLDVIDWHEERERM